MAARLDTLQARLVGRPPILELLSALSCAAGLPGLKIPEQLQLLSLAGATNPVLGVPARKVLTALVHREDFAHADAAAQTKALRQLLVEQPWLEDVLVIPDALYAGRTQGSSIKGPVQVTHTFGLQEITAAALEYQVLLAHGETVLVYLAAGMSQSDLQDCPSIAELATAIATLPPGWTPVLTVLEVLTTLVENGGFMGVLDWHAVWAQPWGKGRQSTLNSALAHEVGHLLSLSAWGFSSWEDSAPEWASWKAAVEQDQLHVSKYARTLLADDVAETLSLCAAVSGTLYEQELRELLPARAALIGELMSGL